MGDKSALKKQYIIEKAREVFVEKGFKSVTMKDIVEACDISRGGLYLYFESTEDVFLEVLNQEKGEDALVGGVSKDSAPTELLTVFLKAQKKDLLSKKGSLIMAVYEFYFGNKVNKKNNFIYKQFDEGVKILEKIIEMGIASGEFYDVDPSATAKNIMLTLEGLRINSLSFGISEKTVDEQLLYILYGLVVED